MSNQPEHSNTEIFNLKQYHIYIIDQPSHNSPFSKLIQYPFSFDANQMLFFSFFFSVQVNIPSTAGDLGILADHVPTIQQLRPGLVEVIESTGSSKQFFVSGGFATVSEGSNLAINVVEAFAPEDFSPEAVKTLLAEAQKNVGSSDPVVAAEASIEVEVLESLSHIAK